MSNHYLAITIAPVLRTIQRARKTRELWASSYVFSLLMRKILDQLQGYKILVPYSPTQDVLQSRHGAGIWPDRCLVQLEKGQLPKAEDLISNAIDGLANAMQVHRDRLEPLLKIFLLHADWDQGDIEQHHNGTDEDQVAIHRLNRLLDNLELATPYHAQELENLNDLLEDQVHQLYQVAQHQDSPVFIGLQDGSVRLPSLPEIALREFRSDPASQEKYLAVIEDPINEKIIRLRQSKARSKDLDGVKDNEQLYADLKSSLGPDRIRLRHKYIAVVVADGDHLGKTITDLSQQDDFSDKLDDFSRALMDFSHEAVQRIVDYGGLPVFAGGDDLLFLAPVTNLHSATEQKNVFGLCAGLNQLFKQHLGQQTNQPSLSFGVSVSYYKFPLGEAVSAARDLGKQAKKFKIWYQEDQEENGKWKPRSEKQALCFQVQKHSGQQFGTTLWLGGEEEEYDWLKLLSAESDIEEAFLASLMHKLQTLPELLAHAAGAGQLEAFREHHFNEGGKHEAPFLKDVLKFAEAVFQRYGNHLDTDLQRAMSQYSLYKDRPANLLALHHTNIIFATLRLKQFLIQPDHD